MVKGSNNGFYTIDGRKLQGKPTQRVYIHNGKKVVIQ